MTNRNSGLALRAAILGTGCRAAAVACVLAAGLLSHLDGARAQELPATPAKALAAEQADRTGSPGFYAVSPAQLQGQPGTLIRAQPADDYSVGKGVRAVRLLYRTRAADGTPVAASGVVLVPGGKAPQGGWPVMAWAHGTSGVAQICAPSMMKDVYYGSDLTAFLNAGFAVVATDYAGLGTAGPHQYLSKNAEANAVIDSVSAARAEVKDLARKWVVIGHSQGGGAAWAVAEHEEKLRDPGYLGAISVAGTLDLNMLLSDTTPNTSKNFYLVFALYGIKARFPQFDFAALLTEAGRKYYEKITQDGCWYYGNALSSSGELGTVVKPDWVKNRWVRRFVAENSEGDRPVGGPVLVIAGEGDHSIPLAMIRRTVGRACKMGGAIAYRTYPGLDHDAVMTKSIPEQIRWLRDRFSGKPAASSCGELGK